MEIVNILTINKDFVEIKYQSKLVNLSDNQSK
jgi:hypothetical protein